MCIFVPSYMDLNELITVVNDAVWGYGLIFALVGCGLWFTIKTRFVQFRMIGEMFRLLTDSAVDTVEEQVQGQREGKKRKHISSFQAFAVSVATRVGTDTVLKTKLFGLKVGHFNNPCLLIAFTRNIHALFSM